MITSTDKAQLQARVVELEQRVADERAHIAELTQQLAGNKVSMIPAIAERVIRATDRLMTDDDSGAMDVITNGQKQLAAIHSINPLDIYHKLRVCLETNDIDVTAEELSDIKTYLAALQAGQLTVVMENHNSVMDICFREVKRAAEAGHGDVEWDNLVRSACHDSYVLLMTKAYYF
ncbi:MAG: hypothetical protein U1D70_07310 [Methylobacter sp.]|nr:hypothetical protein [Methylobacter sp.]MDP2430109.1 hypothetical protein [Methylobacter sp.]MDP3054289.1 hypothetical protein [Methylobacter sp.]MDP3362528.1 hypothetical protein [Methylobacter sp.]MDZ4218817.1 hypothetical protein [Methylobacter sp.]